jgi:hypothetical protein
MAAISPSKRPEITVPGARVTTLKVTNERVNRGFRESVEELNARFRRTATKLNYHNGFIQVATDTLTQDQIEKPFWEIVADPIWKNVDTDMKDALDRRDGNDKDPEFCATRALESTIKIICAKKGWSTGNEKGAHNYIDNLVSAKNGWFIEVWESESLKHIFTHVRNPASHGPGSDAMRTLTPQQIDWVIENCMSWIKSLIQRM